MDSKRLIHKDTREGVFFYSRLTPAESGLFSNPNIMDVAHPYICI